jgi:hypothetical protein
MKSGWTTSRGIWLKRGCVPSHAHSHGRIRELLKIESPNSVHVGHMRLLLPIRDLADPDRRGRHFPSASRGQDLVFRKTADDAVDAKLTRICAQKLEEKLHKKALFCARSSFGESQCEGGQLQKAR